VGIGGIQREKAEEEEEDGEVSVNQSSLNMIPRDPRAREQKIDN